MQTSIVCVFVCVRVRFSISACIKCKTHEEFDTITSKAEKCVFFFVTCTTLSADKRRYDGHTNGILVQINSICLRLKKNSNFRSILIKMYAPDLSSV